MVPNIKVWKGPELVVDFVLEIGDPSWIALSGPAHVGPCRRQYLRAKWNVTKRQAKRVSELVEEDHVPPPDILLHIVTAERDIFNLDFQARENHNNMLRYRHMMLQCIEIADPNCDLYRRFTLAPVNSMHRTFMTVDKDVVNQMFA